MNTLKKSFILFCLILIVRDAIGEYDPDLAIRARNKAAVDQILKENTEKYKNNPDMLVLPGLIADRKAQKVTLLAEATGLTKGSPVEFFLVSETSGHGYESLAVSFAMPGNLQKSLEFIGMKPGRTADAGKCAFWPKGERVIVTFKSKDPEQKDGSTRIETLVLDSRSQKPLPECGLVFTGSPLIQSPEKPGTNVFASDAREPGSLASTYNALETVLDVPFSWAQKTVYGNILANHSNTLKTGSLLEITFEPEYKDGKKRVT
ncbi:MAG: YdjY domain-containing protein, partial [Candidatus Methanoperedens sp.]